MKRQESTPMSEVERLNEVARLMATGFLRYRQNQLDSAGELSVYGDGTKQDA